VQNTTFSSNATLTIRGRLVDLQRPTVMGILNVTPDSFYAGSRVENQKLQDTAGQMLADGATFLDVGGYSTRPGAFDISVEEELDRVLPAVEIIRQHFPEAHLSIDTFRARVADQAISAGAGMINDVSGGLLDPEMLTTVGRLRVPYVLMHMRGTPQTMNSLTEYADVTREVIHELHPRVAQLQRLGVHDIIIDPGFGFAKTVAQNFDLLNHLDAFHIFGKPLLAGLSRKSMIWRTLGTDPAGALAGTVALNTVALLKGAKILRVHDVKPAVECIKLVNQLS
jgi:dihydropteroate synthase